MSAKWMSGYASSAIVAKLENVRDGTSFEGGTFIDLSTTVASIIEFDQQILPIRRSRITVNSILNAARKGTLNADRVLAEVQRLENDFLSKPFTRYVLLTNLSVPYDTALRPRSVNGARIQFSPGMPRGYVRSEQVEKTLSILYESGIPDDFSFVRVETTGRDPEEAGTVAFDALDLLRAFWNFGLGYGIVAIFSNAKLSPINKVLLGPFHTLHHPRGEPVGDVFWFDRTFPSITHVANVDLAEIEKAESAFRRWRNRHPESVRNCV